MDMQTFARSTALALMAISFKDKGFDPFKSCAVNAFTPGIRSLLVEFWILAVLPTRIRLGILAVLFILTIAYLSPGPYFVVPQDIVSNV
jgi:hypothetical protein